MGHNLTFDRRNCWMFVVTFVLLFHVGHGLDVCSWSDISGRDIGKGTYSDPAPGCKMSILINVIAGDITINGERGSYHELQSNRVDNTNVPADGNHRHFHPRAASEPSGWKLRSKP